ncbi:MAG: DNA polymerase III subunit delta' [Desulfuromonadales bacterium C00003094]|jgi:DNA polymerase-3 subunit delta'|nr:MAG: DNA polymerase III subunit delta' [Desulfuromonadales bacterium C00003094]OEU77148.1 MAG: DNA polymerase III subunit delta' [Desulfuromonadales bacterium C00003107]
MTFASIIGHDRQKDLLRRALSSDRVPHAYLFEGPAGVGKRLVALALTRAIFCRQGNGCGDCAACRKVDHHNHPDLHFVEADGNSIKIEQIRTMQKELSYRPLEAPKKICVIDDAEKLNLAAGNALLKTLEEPTANTLIILLTAQPDALLSTVRSRCQRLPFARIERKRLMEVLCEQLAIDEKEAHILTSLANGSFKKALGKDRELYIDGRRDLLKTLTGLSTGSVLPLFNFAEKLAQDKEILPEILEIFQAFYRDLLLYRHGRPESELVNIDLMEKIHRVANNESTPSLLDKLSALNQTRRQLARNVNRQLAVEVLLMHLVA